MNSLDFWRGISLNQPWLRASSTVRRCSGSKVSNLFNKSNPNSERTGAPVKDAAGNFLRSKLYLQ